MVMSARTFLRPTTRSAHGPSTVVSPTSVMPSAAKNAFAASMSSTTMRTLSIRSNLLFVAIYSPVSIILLNLPLERRRRFRGALGLLEDVKGLEHRLFGRTNHEHSIVNR